MSKKQRFNRHQTLAATAKNTSTKKAQKRSDGYGSKIVPKAASLTRRDISAWQGALRSAMNVDTPRRARLQGIYTDIMVDAHLSSQIELRSRALHATPFVLKKDGEVEQEATDMLNAMPWVEHLNGHIFDTDLYGHTLCEFTSDPERGLSVTLLPRTNVVPEQGVLLLSEDDSNGIKYRDAREYGTWLIEFGAHNKLGLLNKAVPHVLFKRFAQSCWSELCEIYGIPPRVMKTNTQDPEMLARAESMMRDMGAAAWYLIDTDENFEWAQGVSTNGDVYNNLINLCKNEISTLICGAVIGQDTVNGNRSKEEVSISVLDTVVAADKRRIEHAWNNIVIPALVRIGVLPDGLRFEFLPQENTEVLFEQTHKIMQYMDVDVDWVRDKFGIEVTGVKSQMPNQQLSAGDFFA